MAGQVQRLHRESDPDQLLGDMPVARGMVPEAVDDADPPARRPVRLPGKAVQALGSPGDSR